MTWWVAGFWIWLQYVRQSPYYALQLAETSDIAGHPVTYLKTYYVRFLKGQAIDKVVLLSILHQTHTGDFFYVLNRYVKPAAVLGQMCRNQLWEV